MSPKELKGLLKVLRTNGVLKYSTPELSLELDRDYLVSDRERSSAMPSDDLIETDEEMTDEMILDMLVPR